MHGICEHCGLSSANSRFCCFGCETAFEIIQGANLGAFYSKRAGSSTPPRKATQFEAFDHEDFLNHHTQFENGFRSAEFYLENLHCGACVWLIERLPQINPFCVSARAHFGTSSVRIRWKDAPKTLSSILSSLAQMGYFPHADALPKNLSRKEWIRWGVSGASAAATMHLGLLLIAAQNSKMESLDAKWIGMLAAITSLPAVIFGGWPFFRSSYLRLCLRKLHPDLLISLAILIGYGFSLRSAVEGRTESYFDSIAMIIFLLLGGRLLVRYSTERISLPPSWIARKIENDLEYSIPSRSLKAGDKIIVRKLEVVPSDIELHSADAWIDRSALSGESTPERILQGQKVPQGAICFSQSLSGLVLRRAEEGSLSKIRDQMKKMVWTSAESSSQLDQIFVVSVFGLSLFALLPFGIDSVSKMVAILVVTCPCALMLSKPLVLNALQRSAHELGIEILEPTKILNFSKISRIAFDKTGTLSEGSLSMIQEQKFSIPGLSELDLSSLIYAMASKSEHPVSRTLAFHFHEFANREVSIEPEEIPHRGLRARWAKHSLQIEKNRNSKMLSAVFKIDGQNAWEFDFEDRPRASAQEALSELRQMNLELALLSGDAKESVNDFVQKIGQDFEIEKAEMSPTEKAKEMNAQTAFVGDGLNDSIAMSRAGVSIGIAGSAEANWKTANVYLLKKDLRLIPALIKASKSADRQINLNLSISLIYNIVAVGLVFNGSIGPVVCAIVMPLSSFTVVGLSNLKRYF